MLTLIEPHPSAPPGIVAKLPQYSEANFVRGCAVLCRNTAPLVGFAYNLLSRDISCKILGKDIGASLVALIKKLRPSSIPDLRERVDAWCEKETFKAISEDRDPSTLYDMAECLRMFIRTTQETTFIDILVQKIEKLFSEKDVNPAVTLSTVHKVKGLEFPTVFILDFDTLMPSPYATRPWQRIQERNLIYVAITRAIHSLYYIESDRWSS